MDFSAEMGDIEDSVDIEATIFLPNLLTKYMQFKDLDASVFKGKWKQLSPSI